MRRRIVEERERERERSFFSTIMKGSMIRPTMNDNRQKNALL